MENNIPTIKRKVIIEMDASFEHYNAFMDLMEHNGWLPTWKMNTTLSQKPQVGEQWRMGNGDLITITDCNMGLPYPLSGSRNGIWSSPTYSWTLDGVHYENVVMDRYNLVERVSMQINVGDYWMLENGQIELIVDIDLTQKYCIISASKSWTLQGIFNTNDLNTGCNLNCRVNVSPV